MSYFKAKMHQIRFRLGLRPRPRWGSLQRSPRPPSCIKGALLLRGREGRGEEGEGEERGEEEEGKGEGEKKGRGREGVAQGPAHARAGSVVPNFIKSKSGDVCSNMVILRFPRWRMSVILHFRGPRMGFLQSTRRTWYCSSVETVARYCLVFQEIAKQMDNSRLSLVYIRASPSSLAEPLRSSLSDWSLRLKS